MFVFNSFRSCYKYTIAESDLDKQRAFNLFFQRRDSAFVLPSPFGVSTEVRTWPCVKSSACEPPDKECSERATRGISGSPEGWIQWRITNRIGSARSVSVNHRQKIWRCTGGDEVSSLLLLSLHKADSTQQGINCFFVILSHPIRV